MSRCPRAQPTPRQGLRSVATDQIAPSSVLRHLVRGYEGGGISRLAEPPAEIHKATKSPVINSRTS